jgi:alpha-1,3/alpha-1,6-mannosyltransferase
MQFLGFKTFCDSMKIAILHPNLGIGGAERLVLDAALAYKENGHDVCIVTNYFSEDHCFADALTFKNGNFG